MTSSQLPRIKNVKLNILMNTVLRVSAFIFPLITFPYVTRVLGAAGNGKVAFAESVISYFAMFSQLGIPMYGIKVCAGCRDDRDKLNRTVQELLIINIVTFLISYIALVICIQLVPRFESEKLLLLVSSASMLLNVVGVDWLFQALEQYSYITVRNIAFKVIAIVLMFALVHSSQDYVVLAGINVVGAYGACLINFIYAGRFLSLKPLQPFQNYNFKRHVKPIFMFFLLTVSISIYINLDSVMLGFLSTDEQVGYFSAGTKIKNLLVNAVAAVGTVMLPRMSAYFSQGKLDEFHAMIRKSLNLVLIITFPLAVFSIVMAKPAILILAGVNYEPAIVPMQILAITVIFVALSNVFGLQVLVPTNREKYTVISTAVGAVVDLIINLCLIPYFGAIGTAIATAAAEFSVLLVQLVYLRHEIRIMHKGIQFIKILVAALLSCAPLAVMSLLECTMNNVAFFSVGCLLYFISYCMLLCVFKEAFTRRYIAQFTMRITGRFKTNMNG